MKTAQLEKPIFFIGVPRSGTTIVFEAFAHHEALGWPSNYSQMHPRHNWLNVLRRLLDNNIFQLSGRKKQHSKVPFGNRYLPMPDEAYNFWNQYSGKTFSKNYLLKHNASEKEKNHIREALKAVIRWQGKSRLAAKLTGPARIGYLKSIFDDAIFVHVIRDGRAVVNSLLKVPFWREGGGFEHPWWEGGLSQDYLDIWNHSGSNPAVLAAIQWRRIIELAREEAAQLKSGQYHEICYEQFVEDQHATLCGLFDACGLEDSPRVHKYIEQGPMLHNMNARYMTDMQADDIQQMTTAMQPLLDNLGYE